MKNRVYALLIGAAFGLGTCGVSHAKSELVNLTVEPQWPATSVPGTVILYRVTAVTRAGQGLLEVSLSSLGFPAGATAVFSPSALRFTGGKLTTQTATLTVTCTNVMPTDTYAFTVTGTAQREAITVTNVVQQAAYRMAPEPPTLALDGLGGGSLMMRGKGASGQTYQIQSTPSLSNPTWAPVGTSTADGNGRFTFMSTVNNQAPIQFYRSVSPVATPAP